MTVNSYAARAMAQKWDPHAYQKRAIKFLLGQAHAALFLDPGLGKTSIVLAALKLLKRQGHPIKALVIAPLRVCHLVWPAELHKWVDFHGLTMEVLHGPKKEAALARPADIYVINPEGLPWLLGAEVASSTAASGATTRKVRIDSARWRALGFTTLIIDELTKFKHQSSIRYKLLKLIHTSFERRWGLTGSPAASGLLNLFGQCYMLDEGRSLGRYFSHYRQEYFMTVDYQGFVWVPQPGAEERIYQRVKPLALRMGADEYLEMPKLVVNDIKVTLPAKVMAQYLAIERDMLVEVNGKLVMASNAGITAGKCHQIANGGVYITPELVVTGFKLPKTNPEWLNLHDAKTEALVDLVDELQGQPLLVAYEYRHDLYRLQAALGKAVPYLGEGVGVRQTRELEAAWNQGRLPVLLAQIQAAGHGLNLQQVGHHVAWYSLTYDYELYDQFIRRVWRQGNQHSHVFVHHFIAVDTVDEVIINTLRGKKRTQQAFFEGLKKRVTATRK